MAKRDNMPPEDNGLTGGLQFGASKEVKERQKAVEQEKSDTHRTSPHTSSLVEEYQETWKRNERRSIKFNIMITPTLSKKLDRSVDRGEIRSRNDLINHLLEKYYEEESKSAR